MNEITEFKKFDAEMKEFRARYEGVVYDLTDPSQEKQARSDRLSIGKVIATLDRTHKDLKAPLKAQTDLLDTERKRIKDDLLGIQGKIKSQIAEHEQAIAERAEMLQQKVEAIESLAVFEDPPQSSVVAARLEQLLQLDVDDSYEERKADAALAQIDARKSVSALLESTLKAEAEQAELERLRKEQAARERAEQDERIRAEAAATAKQKAENIARRQAEEAARKIADALEEAARSRIAVEAEKRNAEHAAVRAAEEATRKERERIEAIAKKAAEREKEEKKKDDTRKAKQVHRAKIHEQAKESLILLGLTAEAAIQLVVAIKDGKIANVAIQY